MGGRVGRDVRAISPIGLISVVLGLLFGLAGTSSSAVTVTLPALADTVRVTPSTGTWVISGYAVALAVATAVHGRIADLVGIRTPLVVGVALMAVGALAAAVAPSFGLLVAARVVQGIGAASIPVLATALITAGWDGAERAGALGRIAGLSATVSALGPTFGGGLEAFGGWRLAVALPAVGALAIPVLWRHAPSGGSRERFDLLGALFVAVAATGLVLIIQSPSGGVRVAIVGAALLVAAVPAVLLRIRARPDGFLPRKVITNGVVLRAAFAAASIPAAWFALLLGVPLALAARGWSPLATGLVLVPAAVAGLLVPRLSRAVLPRVGPTTALAMAAPTAAVALLVAALGVRLAAVPLLALGVLLVTVAFGVGQPAMVAAVSAAVPEPRRGVALGVATLFFLVGAGIGAAVVGGIADLVGVAGALTALVALPLLGTAVVLLARRPRPIPAEPVSPVSSEVRP